MDDPYKILGLPRKHFAVSNQTDGAGQSVEGGTEPLGCAKSDVHEIPRRVGIIAFILRLHTLKLQSSPIALDPTHLPIPLILRFQLSSDFIHPLIALILRLH